MKCTLPEPKCSTSVTVEEALRARRSLRDYSDKPILLSELSQLLWAAQGITGGGGKRAAPSAGAEYPLRVFVVSGMVSEVPAGIHVYDGTTHSIQLLADSDPRQALCEAALGDQPWVGKAPVVLALTANFGAVRDRFRSQPPQGRRGERYVYIETGAAAQNVNLEAMSLGIGAVLVAGFDDSKVQDALHLPEELEPTALLCIGAGK